MRTPGEKRPFFEMIRAILVPHSQVRKVTMLRFYPKSLSPTSRQLSHTSEILDSNLTAAHLKFH